MEDLRSETFDVLASLTAEQVLMVLAYARALRDGDAVAAPGHGLEDLLEEPA